MSFKQHLPRKEVFTLAIKKTAGTQWASWLRHRATRRKVAVSIPYDVIGIFIDIILPALGSTQPLTEMSTRNISWGVKAAGALG
jgi:hypothetical protein